MLPQEPMQGAASPTTLVRSHLQTGYAPSAQPTLLDTQQQQLPPPQHVTMRTPRYNGSLGSTAKGIMIGIFSVLGAAGVCLIIAAIVYYFRYTSQGRIFLDRITRPGEYDDEQQFAKEEAEALEEMDDIQRTEYMRAKGIVFMLPRKAKCKEVLLTFHSFCPSQSSRICANRYLAFTILGHSRKGCVCLGIRTRAGDCKLLCRSAHRD